jgi:hypothetical protein
MNTSFEKTQLLAYQLWEQANQPPGRDVDFWVMAEHQLKSDSSQEKPRSSARAKSQRTKIVPEKDAAVGVKSQGSGAIEKKKATKSKTPQSKASATSGA